MDSINKDSKNKKPLTFEQKQRKIESDHKSYLKRKAKRHLLKLKNSDVSVEVEAGTSKIKKYVLSEAQRQKKLERDRQYRLKRKIEKLSQNRETMSPVSTSMEVETIEAIPIASVEIKLEKPFCESPLNQAWSVCDRLEFDVDHDDKTASFSEVAGPSKIKTNKYVFSKKQHQRKLERDRLYRLKRKFETISSASTSTIMELENIKTIPITAADIEFEKRLTQNPFGHACSICDRLWFKDELRQKNLSDESKNLLSTTFPDEDTTDFKICRSCYWALKKNTIPRLSRSNGFVYPPYPTHLPEFDFISQRLVSPRVPFVQIRRLRCLNDSKGIISQVINVPLELNTMVSELPRQMDDDYAFNVHIQRHQIQKSPYLAGIVNKSKIKSWLNYLLEKPLYKINNIKINNKFFADENDDAPSNPNTESDDAPLIENIPENLESTNDIFSAKQHTLMWSEDKYLDQGPGMNKKPLSLILDEYAEELSFPSIYLGEPRAFKLEHITPLLMASSEIRRRDRRGVTPEHILYMAMKIMRIRLTESLYTTFEKPASTRKVVDDACVEKNLSFLKTIPNSVQYWAQRKKDVFAMIRQLGKPTLFLTLSASEYNWPKLLSTLYRVKFGKNWPGKENDIIREMNSDLRTTLVNEDPVTCCIYFEKLVDTIIFLLKSPRYSPFKSYRVIDFFKRIGFQECGMHAHILLWLENDPGESIGKNMPNTLKLIDSVCSVDPNKLINVKDQTRKHSSTCYERSEDACRFGAPFWPMLKTVILSPMSKTDPRWASSRTKYKQMHRSLELEEFENLDEFLQRHVVNEYATYLNIVRAGINSPRVFLKRTIQQKWMNNFNPWISRTLNSNMDIQFILDEYSCAKYVTEYVNNTNRGMSHLQKELIKLRYEYPEKDFTELLTCYGSKMLNSVELSSQEAAWYLLNLHMSEASRKIDYVPTVWPHERQREELAENSTDLGKKTCFEKYQKRPQDLENVSLAEFTTCYYKDAQENYHLRGKPEILRFRNYDERDEPDNYKREMVLLHVPHRNEEIEFLDESHYQEIYEEKELQIIEARKKFESNLDIEKVLDECKRLCLENGEDCDNKGLLKVRKLQSIKDEPDDD